MDVDKEFDEGFLALIGFNLVLSIIAAIEIYFTYFQGKLMNMIDYSYLEFPHNDFMALLILFMINFAFLFFFMGQSSKFRRSANLTYRQSERWGFAVKSAIYNGLYSVHLGFMTFFFIKYILTSLAYHLFFSFFFELILVVFLFSGVFRMLDKSEEELDE
jgi:hypothetical protein